MSENRSGGGTTHTVNILKHYWRHYMFG